MTRPFAPIQLLPDLMALVAAGIGVSFFEGTPRLLCGLAAFAALGRVGVRAIGTRRGFAADASVAQSLFASVPALLLLVGIVAFARSAPQKAVHAAAPTLPVDLSALPDAARDCLATKAAKTYLDDLHRKLEKTWDEQDEPATGGFVELGFVLEESGAVRLSRVIDQSSDEYRALGTAVLEASAPFGELAGDIACLSGVELRATLDRSAGR